MGMCPMQRSFSQRFASWDAGVFKALDSPFLYSWCAWEDHFCRLFTDLWVHAIVTETDTLLNLAVTTTFAFLWKWTVLDHLVTLWGLVYGILVFIWTKVEEVIPGWGVFRLLEGITSVFNVLGADQSRQPPRTLWRTRRSRDLIDDVSYRLNRQTRHITYYWRSGSDILSAFLFQGMLSATLLRVLLLSGGGHIIRDILVLLGYRDVIKQHQEWFKHAGNDLVSQRIDEAIMHAARMIPISRSGFAILLITLVVMSFLLRQHIQSQRERFDEDWKHTQRKANVGECEGCEKCKCTSSSHIPKLSEDEARSSWWWAQ